MLFPMSKTTELLKKLYQRSGVGSYEKLANAMRKAGDVKPRKGSSVQRYFKDDGRKKEYIQADVVEGFERAFVGLGDPPITREEVWALAGPGTSFAAPAVTKVLQAVAEATGRFSADIPLCGAVAGSEEAFVVNDGHNEGETVARHPLLRGIDGAFAAYVLGESMVPRFNPGEIVYIHPARPPMKGWPCVIEMKNGEGYLKIYDGMDDANVHVTQYNPAKKRHFRRADVRRVMLVVGTGIR